MRDLGILVVGCGGMGTNHSKVFSSIEGCRLIGFVDRDGPTQMAIEELALAGGMPNLARCAGKDPFQITSYVDGTKTMFEMTCAANATGDIPST